MKPVVLLSVLLTVLAVDARGQIPPPPGACPTGTADAVLQARSVEAPVFNTGSLFWRAPGSPFGFRDRASGVPSLLAASFWIGGRIDGFLYMAASMLGPWEFWPGPILEDGLPAVDCSPYDRIWRISRVDIQQFDRTGEVSSDLADWPWMHGAPVTDGDGIGGNYNLNGGDRPALLGDRMLWWVMNDRAGNHRDSQGIPLTAQVQVSAFAFDLPGATGRSLFFRYRVVRRGQLPVRDTRMGLFVYAGLGNLTDDYVGADTTLHMAYAYNADNDDEGGFGVAPPATGVAILRSATIDGDETGDVRAEVNQQLGALFTYQALCDACNPYPRGRGEGYFEMMGGRFPWGQEVSRGDVTTSVMFSGSPPAYWSEMNVDDMGTASEPGDRKMVISTAPFSMVPGDVHEIVFAFVQSSGTDHLDSVDRLRADVAFLQDRTPALLTPIGPGTPIAAPRETLSIGAPYPNPAQIRASVGLVLPEPLPVRVDVLDSLGRAVRSHAYGTREPGNHTLTVDVADLPPGVYFYRIWAGSAVRGQPFTVLR